MLPRLDNTHIRKRPYSTRVVLLHSRRMEPAGSRTTHVLHTMDISRHNIWLSRVRDSTLCQLHMRDISKSGDVRRVADNTENCSALGISRTDKLYIGNGGHRPIFRCRSSSESDRDTIHVVHFFTSSLFQTLRINRDKMRLI